MVRNAKNWKDPKLTQYHALEEKQPRDTNAGRDSTHKARNDPARSRSKDASLRQKGGSYSRTKTTSPTRDIMSKAMKIPTEKAAVDKGWYKL